MYQSSEAFGNWIQQDSRTFQARITLEGKTITEGILSIRLNGGSNSEDDFSLGFPLFPDMWNWKSKRQGRVLRDMNFSSNWA